MTHPRGSSDHYGEGLLVDVKGDRCLHRIDPWFIDRDSFGLTGVTGVLRVVLFTVNSPRSVSGTVGNTQSPTEVFFESLFVNGVL